MSNPYTTPTSPSVSKTPSELSTQDKNMAMFAHLSTFLGCIIPMGNVLAPLIFWQLKKDTQAYVATHAKEALNFQISLMIYLAVSFILTAIFIGFIGLIVLLIGNIIFTIIGAIKANDGSLYSYPMTLRLIK